LAGLIAALRLFLLDEVTEGLQRSVVDRLSEVLVATRREAGTAMLVVEQHIPSCLISPIVLPSSSEVKRSTPAISRHASAALIDEHPRI